MTRVKLSKHPSAPGMRVAAVTVPLVVGDVPGSLSVCCTQPTARGALASAAMMAKHVTSDASIGAVVPDNTFHELDAMYNIAAAADDGQLAQLAPALGRSHRRLAGALARIERRDARRDVGALEVAGFFDSIASLASKVAKATVHYADPDQWPDWMKKIAKPLSRVALDAAATAVLGPAGPIAVETMINVVDKARSGDKDAEDKVKKIAARALKGDDAAKVLMSAVHLNPDGTAAAGDKVGQLDVGDAADDYMAMYGRAMDPRTWEGAADGDNTYALPPGGGYYPDDAYAQPYAPQYAEDYAQPDYAPAPYAMQPAPAGWQQTQDGGWLGPDGAYYPPGTDPNDPNNAQQQPDPNAPPPVVRDHRQGAQGSPASPAGAHGGFTVTPSGNRGARRAPSQGKPPGMPWAGGMFGQAGASWAQQLANQNRNRGRDHRGR